MSACEDTHPAAIPDKPNTQAALQPPPLPKHDNVGTGRLAHTRFAVPPVVSVIVCTKGGRKCLYLNYAVFARLTRDIPRRSSGLIAANFDVNGLDNGDPIGRMSKPRFCFQQTVATDYAEPAYPTRVGARVVVTLTSYDKHGDADGTLATAVHLSPPKQQRTAVGC